MPQFTHTDAPGPDQAQATVDKVTVQQLADDSPDTSWLENFPERLEAYQAGEFCFIGIQARAQVSYSIGQGSRRLEWFTSGGLWGVESDSGQEYLDEVAQDELADLKSHLERFNVDTSNWADVAPE